VVEGARLESVYTPKWYPGFESQSLRLRSPKFRVIGTKASLANAKLPWIILSKRASADTIRRICGMFTSFVVLMEPIILVVPQTFQIE
jgi:hypothetical protein